ncbi:MAG: translational GTPase TypA [Planctomycetes bacterium]|jgi:GTP-binding protein|nr:translational GTPase TypA [Planctomycetota bacterium]MCL4731093.1 translational GTPase TypA [Planctomycetota bacterium]
MRRDDIRNLAVIAHVDHGKTTLVDGFLELANFFGHKTDHAEAFMDSNPLERERGITILAKNVSFKWKGIKVNLIDTPGHADFAGEVERVLSMADGCFLLVDAAEGPMPQTKFVLRKALEHNLKPLVVINKIDRPDARINEVLDLVFQMFLDLGASDAQLDFPVIYASGRQRIASEDPVVPGKDLVPLMDAMINRIPGPEVEPDMPFQVQITNFLYDQFVGRVGIGRIMRGTLKVKDPVVILKRDGRQVKAVAKQVQVFDGLARKDVPAVRAGDIVAIVGLEGIDIGDTVADPEHPDALPPVPIDQPTITMEFRLNDSPFAGQEGQFVTSRQIRDRLERAAEADVALKVQTDLSADSFMVQGRGTLHLGVLVENMRREGYEFAIGAPEVIVREENGIKTEPFEEAVVDVPSEHSGRVIELLGGRAGVLVNMESHGPRSVMHFSVPSRGLIGMRTRILTATQGEAIFTHRFVEYRPMAGPIPRRNRGALIATDGGKVTSYALEYLTDRGEFFVETGDQVYVGQVVGENCRENDIGVNVCRTKHLTNIRSSTKEAFVKLKTRRDQSLEAAMEWIEGDELVEVTPKGFRIRKRLLDENARKRAARAEAG